MKKYLILLVVCLFCSLGYAQDIKAYSSYTEAMKEFSSHSENQKLMMIYFFDGKNSKLDRAIRKQIIKSEKLEQFGKDVVLLTIDVNDDSDPNAYNSRALAAYNYQNIFPAIKVYVPGHSKSLPLQITFEDQDISNFLLAIKSL